MIANHVAVRAQKYVPYVRKSARKYGIDESLILVLCKRNPVLTRMRLVTPMPWG